ncbi:SGNH/GDSL hydrolase family protein [Altererythrobacter sp. ZODW24]|uniref:SGNH/GDSL hydrolase family protein n=1 Tax=Altererythrobacter sp. ZODW24 TaxID=2185142 RepID=UPI000DF72F94|nr:SGNH/GDSL hydrolase family protein [Altererythrobacter sp. ZODW24]
MALDFAARGLTAAETARSRRIGILSTLRRSMERTGLSAPEMAAALPAISAPATASIIGSSVLHSALSEPEQFHLTGGVWSVAGPQYPKNQFVRPMTVHPGISGDPAADAQQGQGQRVRFVSWAPALELRVLYGDAFGGFRLKVDGEYVHLGLLGNSSDGTPVGAPRVIGVNWGDGSATERRARVYELEWSSNGAFGGVYTAPEYDVQPAKPVNGLNLLVHGDSMLSTVFDTATFANAAQPSQGTLLANLLGQPDCWVSGVGGTGWVNDNGGAKATFGARQALDVIAPAPDVIIELGGRNDGGLISQIELEGLVRAWIANVLASRPDTIIFMSGPILSRGGAENSAASNIAVRDAKRNAAASFPRNVAFIDNLARKWSTGSGRQTAPLGDGNADWCTGADSAHFTHEGHEFCASQVAHSIAAAVGPLIAAQ